MPQISPVVRASLALTISAITLADTQTCTIAGKVYTFQTTLTNVDGNVAIGATVGAMGDNLAAAINLGAGAGTAYAAAMTKNQHVYAVSDGAGVVTVYAKVPGVIGNFLTVSETLTNSAWAGGATVLAGGSGHIYTAINELRSQQPNSNILASLDAIDASGLGAV